MRKPDRIEPFLAELAKYWHKVPDWRFGQLLSNIPFDRDIFFMEEDEFMNYIKKYFKEYNITIEEKDNGTD